VFIRVSFICIYYFVRVCICVFSVFFVFFGVVFLCSFLLQYCDTVGWVFWPEKTVGRITYIVLLQTLNHAQSKRVGGDPGSVDVFAQRSQC